MDQMVDLMLGFYAGPVPYLIVFAILLACGLGVPIPEDLTLIAGGLIAYYGVANVWVMLVVSFLGIMIGDCFVFYIGAKYGRKITRVKFFSRFLTEERLEIVQAKYRRYGNKLIFAARFMPGFRAPVFFSSGVLHLPFRVFLFYDGLAALISVPTIIFAVYVFGDRIDLVIKKIQAAEKGMLVLILSAVLFIGLKWYLAKRRSTSSSPG